MTITPDQADQWAQEATDGPWCAHTNPDDPDDTFIYGDGGDMCIAVGTAGSDYLEADLDLIAAAPDLAKTIAEMTEEWRAELRESWGAWLPVTAWTTEEDARRHLDSLQLNNPTARFIRRLVSPVEVVE